MGTFETNSIAVELDTMTDSESIELNAQLNT